MNLLKMASLLAIALLTACANNLQPLDSGATNTNGLPSTNASGASSAARYPNSGTSGSRAVSTVFARTPSTVEAAIAKENASTRACNSTRCAVLGSPRAMPRVRACVLHPPAPRALV